MSSRNPVNTKEFDVHMAKSGLNLPCYLVWQRNWCEFIRNSQHLEVASFVCCQLPISFIPPPICQSSPDIYPFWRVDDLRFWSDNVRITLHPEIRNQSTQRYVLDPDREKPNLDLISLVLWASCLYLYYLQYLESYLEISPENKNVVLEKILADTKYCNEIKWVYWLSIHVSLDLFFPTGLFYHI